MENQSENTKRIAKNTLMLYVRTFIVLCVTLYTSRVVLNTLGVVDYGIFCIVGGVIGVFSVISGSLSASISRFITFEIGHGDYNQLKRIFSTSLNIQIFISLLLLVLGELIGVWFLNSKMNIPSERLYAANWVLQSSLLSFVLGIITLPYNACIIAHERMSVYAYISIAEVFLKLFIVYMLFVSSADKLILYACCLFMVSMIMQFSYICYCRKHFPESRYVWIYDSQLIKKMTGFAGWSLFGNGAYMLNVQGVDILINLFFGLTFNAARGIASQVQNAVLQFVNNFTVAVNPQITKSYASGDMEYMHNVMCRGSKFAYYLLLLFTVPIVCEADYILYLWLKVVPENAPIFLRLTLFGALVTILGNPILAGITASGNIRQYQIWITVFGCLVFPFTWLAYELGASVIMAYVIYIIVYFLLNFVRLYFAKKLLLFPIRIYLKKVMFPVFLVSVLVFIVPLLLLSVMHESFVRLCLITGVSVLLTLGIIYQYGLDKLERSFIMNKLKSRFCIIRNQ